MRISIAMATYNGGKYLQGQLDSFVAQVRLPNELIICDDGSTDDTVKIIREFASSAPFQVQLHCNESRLGFVQNFALAISKATGDLIFLSDQDDIWFPQKVKKIEVFFANNPSVWLAVNDAEITDDLLVPLGVTSAQRVEWSGQDQGNLVNGCFMSFRAEFKKIILPIPMFIQAHDTWINTLGRTLNVRKNIPDVLQYYRRHASNTSQWMASSSSLLTRLHLVGAQFSRKNRSINPVEASDRRILQVQIIKERLQQHASSLEKYLDDKSTLCKAIDALDFERDVNEQRRLIQKQKKMRRLYSSWKFYRQGGYHFFEGWKSMAKDLLL